MNKAHRKIGTKAGQINKGEMLDIVLGLSDRGLGANAIAGLIGYHPSTIKRYLRDLGVLHMTQARRVERIVANLPPQLLADACRIRRLSEALDARSGAIEDASKQVMGHIGGV